MENIIKYYKTYVDYSNKQKMLPSEVDGCLISHRRMLLTLHNIASNKFVKSAEVLGTMMSRYHPHASADSVAETLVQNGIAEGSGSWGTTIGIEKIGAAAPRYTKMKSSKRIENLVFKFINSVEYIDNELDNKEPKFLSAQFPLCLLYKNELVMIAAGFKTEIPTYEQKDLYKRLLYLLDNKNNKEPIIKPYIYNCNILSSKKDLKKILTDGEGKIDIQGIYKENKSNNTIYIKGWNPRVGFQSILNKINKYNNYNLLNNEMIGFIDESTQNIGTNIKFEVLKQRNTSDIYDKMKEAIDESLKATISYNIYVVTKDDKVILSNVDNMLLSAYNHFKTTFKKDCENSIESINNKINEFNIINTIRPYISDAIKLSTEDKMIEYISKKSKVSIENIKEVIDKYKIRKLLTISLDITDLNNKLNEYENKLKNLEKSVLEEYKLSNN